jgi:hypothetical protein
VSVHDEDILDFDFVEDSTVEAQPATRPGGRPPDDGEPPSDGGGRGPRRPQIRAPQGWTPLLRLIGLIAFAILIAVLLVVWAQGCADDQKQDAYTDYTTQMGDIAADSVKTGRNLAELVTEPGLKEAVLETKLSGLVQAQQQGIARAEALDVPGPLRPAHEKAIEALAFRANGMRGLLEAFRATATSQDASAAGQQLASQATRLQASDVVWQDLFRVPAVDAMTGEGVTGLNAPVSVFVVNPDLYSSRSLASIWTRIHGASTGGTPTGLHGTSITSTTVQPANVQLSTEEETTIIISQDLAIDVAVTNSGDFQEVGVEVTLTIPTQPTPIVKKGKVDVIDEGETKTVSFRDFGDAPFDKTTIQVSVTPVLGEENETNNTAEYPVIFSLEP